MTPYYADDWLSVYHGDAAVVLATLEPESVHCVVTSPPFWGLRDYGTATWVGGEAECDHLMPLDTTPGGRVSDLGRDREASGGTFHGGPAGQKRMAYRAVCGKCGATRIDGQLGLEPTPEEYVANLVAVFREVRRALRADGTVWLNLGDSYAASQTGHGQTWRPKSRPIDIQNAGRSIPPGLKPKDLVGIPWRVAFALQADGWYLRSDIIWSKNNPMPESVTDRPTKSHEYLFLLSKSARYFWDADAVREPNESPEQAAHNARYAKVYEAHTERVSVRGEGIQPGNVNNVGIHSRGGATVGRNIRSVWTIATAPYPGQHFATFPPKLVEPCIKAGTSERGVCPECGAPWERVVERTPMIVRPSARLAERRAADDVNDARTATSGTMTEAPTSLTTGWRPSCPHYPRTSEWPSIPPRVKDEPEDIYQARIAPILALRADLLAVWEPLTSVLATVLDPFAGSGTTGMVAQSLSRRAVLIDLSLDYLGQLMDRNADIPLGLGA